MRQGRLLPDEGVGGAGGVVAATHAARVDPLHGPDLQVTPDPLEMTTLI